ncbi:MAG: hypothetical protein EOP06_28245 [Proteobacteria bacterium]|nr:MAG: hypothetical protein EOP06_28245 [Pseudomonadota bacterium]
MATPRKGWRRIVVDGAIYRWTVSRQAKYWDNYFYSPMQFTVESPAGALLTVKLNRPRLDYWIAPERKEEMIPVTPHEVAQEIRNALRDGWNPQVKTTPFFFQTCF